MRCCHDGRSPLVPHLQHAVPSLRTAFCGVHRRRQDPTHSIQITADIAPVLRNATLVEAMRQPDVAQKPTPNRSTQRNRDCCPSIVLVSRDDGLPQGCPATRVSGRSTSVSVTRCHDSITVRHCRICLYRIKAPSAAHTYLESGDPGPRHCARPPAVLGRGPAGRQQGRECIGRERLAWAECGNGGELVRTIQRRLLLIRHTSPRLVHVAPSASTALHHCFRITVDPRRHVEMPGWGKRDGRRAGPSTRRPAHGSGGGNALRPISDCPGVVVLWSPWGFRSREGDLVRH
jgi:hypothetical protein